MKQKIEFTDNVSETLLIPLWMRAADPMLHDKYSLAIVEQIDYDFEKFSIDKSISQTSVTVEWGADSPREVCAWLNGITAIADYKYLHHAKGIFGLIGRLIPLFGNSCGIYGFRFG